MKRRKFVQAIPAAVVAGAIAPEAAARDAEGRRMLDPDKWKPFEVEDYNFFMKMDFELLSFDGHRMPDGIWLDHMRVYCPHEAGSKMWLPIADHQGGNIVVATADGEASVVSPKVRRVIFPTVITGGDDLLIEGFEEEGFTVFDRIKEVYFEVFTRGFDGVKPHEDGWKVVWVEFLCHGGKKEHIIAGLPNSWDSKLALDIMEKKRIK